MKIVPQKNNLEYPNIPLNKTKDSKRFQNTNKEFYSELVRRGSVPQWFGIMEMRVFTNFHKDIENSISHARDFIHYCEDYEFRIGKKAHKLLNKGKCTILGYDRSLRPVLLFDLFELEIDHFEPLVECFQLFAALAFTKMMVPGINDGFVVVLDLSYRYYKDTVSVRDPF